MTCDYNKTGKIIWNIFSQLSALWVENYYVNCVNFILTSKSQNFKWIFPLLFWNWWWIRPWAIFHFFPLLLFHLKSHWNDRLQQQQHTKRVDESNLIFTFHQIRACIIKWKKFKFTKCFLISVERGSFALERTVIIVAGVICEICP